MYPHLEISISSRAGYTGALTTKQIMKSFPPDLKWAVAGRSADKPQRLVFECQGLEPNRPQSGMKSHLSLDSALTVIKEIEVRNVNGEELGVLARKKPFV
jgi:hypothetical protein